MIEILLENIFNSPGNPYETVLDHFRDSWDDLKKKVENRSENMVCLSCPSPPRGGRVDRVLVVPLIQSVYNGREFKDFGHQDISLEKSLP